MNIIDDKQRASLRVSLIPIVVLIGLILGAGYFLLKGEITLPKLNKGPTIQRLGGFPTIIYTDKELDKQRKVITNEQELNEFLNLVDETGLLTVKEEINFEKSVVLAVASATNEETGHKIKIKSVYEDKEEQEILVEFEETDPDNDCEYELDKNIAVDMVVLSKTDYEINFEKITKVIQCPNEERDTQKESTESSDIKD